jgi:hypothetical protein
VSTEPSPKSIPNFRPLIGLFACVLAIQAVVGYFTYLAFADWPTRASFGDMLGAVNSLFSGLAFAGVIYAILLQRRELSLQRLELELTRQELARSAEAQAKSAGLLTRQVQIMKADSLPLLRPEGVNFDNQMIFCKFINEGGLCKFPRILSTSGVRVNINPADVIHPQQHGTFILVTPAKDVGTIDFSLSCRTALEDEVVILYQYDHALKWYTEVSKDVLSPGE